MRESVRCLPLILSCCILVEQLAVGKLPDPVVSANCSEEPPPEVQDCSTIISGICTLQRDTETDPEELHYPADNTRSRYKTCLVEDPQFPNIMACEISKIRFEDKALKMQKGPIETSVTFNYFKLFSRNFNNEKAYPKNELALYSAFCNKMHVDSILTVSMSQHSLESTAPCPNQEMCVDYVKMELPYGDICTTCGDLPLKCRENAAYELPTQLYFDGIHQLRMKFRTNRQENNLLHGFQFLTSCVEKGYFFADNCTTPNATSGRKRRNISRLEVQSIFQEVTTSVKLRKLAEVYADASVSYSGFAVKIIGYDKKYRKYANIHRFIVFNSAEGLRTYTGVALMSRYNSVAGIRTFPGYGVLYISPFNRTRRIRTAYFHQTGIAPEFLPTPEEAEIIHRLRTHITTAVLVNDSDLDDERGLLASEVIAPQSLPFERIQRSVQTDEDALTYGNACNGILRADACVYQQLFFGNVTEDCLQGLL